MLDLFRRDDPFDLLWHALREHRLQPLRNRIAGDRPVDITLRARGGYLGVNCIEDLGAQERGGTLLPERWEILNLPVVRINQDLEACLRQIGAALITLGGSVLNARDRGD